MTLPIERARTRRPVTWLTLIGVLLLPVVIGGILVAALYNPAERLDSMSAAIVNEDEPVTIDDQYVPLGRQLTAGLVEGSDEIAEQPRPGRSPTPTTPPTGLADGTYQAVVTIPENFSAAATSTAPGRHARAGDHRGVRRRPTPQVVDDAITAQVTSAAASIMGDAALAGLPRERVPRLHDARRPARRGRRRRAPARRRRAAGRRRRRAAAGRRDAARRRRVAARVGRGRARGGLDQIAAGTAASASGAGQLADGLDSRGRQVSNQRARRRRSGDRDATPRPPRRRPRPLRAERRRRSRRRSAGSPASASPRAARPTFCDAAWRTAAATAGSAATRRRGGRDERRHRERVRGSDRRRHPAAHVADERRTDGCRRPDAARSPAASTQLASGTTQSADGARGLAIGRGAARRRRDQLSDGRADRSPTASQSLADGTDDARGRPGSGIRRSAVLHRHRGDEPRRRRRRPGRRRRRRLIALRRVGRAAARDARALVRRTRHVRRAAGGIAPRPHLASAVRRCSRCAASRRPPRSAPCRGFWSPASCSSPRPTTGREWSLFAALCVDRGRRLRRREPGARRRVRRRRPLARGPRRRARRGHRRGLHRARRAVGRRRAPADRARLQRHARGADRRPAASARRSPGC